MAFCRIGIIMPILPRLYKDPLTNASVHPSFLSSPYEHRESLTHLLGKEPSIRFIISSQLPLTCHHNASRPNSYRCFLRNCQRSATNSPSRSCAPPSRCSSKYASPLYHQLGSCQVHLSDVPTLRSCKSNVRCVLETTQCSALTWSPGTTIALNQSVFIRTLILSEAQ